MEAWDGDVHGVDGEDTVVATVEDGEDTVVATVVDTVEDGVATVADGDGRRHTS